MDLVTKQREERKQRILDVARRLIAEHGYEGVTMRELAEESLVSVPTLYNLFGGKNELLFSAVESYFVQLFGSAEPSDGEPGLPALLSMCQVMSMQMVKHADYARSLMGFFAWAPESSSLRDFVARQLSDGLTLALNQMQAKRQLVAWLDTTALGERLASLLIITSFEWANRRVSDVGLESALLFATSSMVLGFARGKASGELEDLARRCQGRGEAAES